MPRPEHHYRLDDKVRQEQFTLKTGPWPRLLFSEPVRGIQRMSRSRAAAMLSQLRAMAHYAKALREVNTLAVKRIKN